jgi:invasion protein IalB
MHIQKDGGKAVKAALTPCFDKACSAQLHLEDALIVLIASAIRILLVHTGAEKLLTGEPLVQQLEEVSEII